MSQAFVYDVHKTSDDSHQTSPAWMLTFIRWANRDPKNYTNPQKAGGNLAVIKPLIVINDCVSVTVNSSKSSHTPSMTAILKGGDINYLTAVAPGDFVFVNIADWSTIIDEVAEKAKALEPINGFEDGFKGYFKVQSVRRISTINPATGTKQIMYQIDGYGFTEFNNMIYFNPHLIPAGGEKSALFVTNLSQYWHSQFSTNGFPFVQQTMTFFIRSFLGDGALASKVNETIKKAGANAQFSYNTQFYVPSGVGNLLGQKDAKAAKDLYIYLMGIQTYNSGNLNDPEKSFIPSNLQEKSPVYGRFFYTTLDCQGRAYVKPDYWNQVPVWSILEQYLNSPINEMYTCYRIAPNGLVMPTLVMRQIPFSSEKYKGISTKFLNLPRWRVSPELIYDINIGRDEALRFNFVQVFGAMGGMAKPNLTISHQIAKGNYDADFEDIQRSGLRPYVVTSNFDLPSIKGNIDADTKLDQKTTSAFAWKNLLADCLIGGHLKMSGSIVCAGIEAPIAPGDNLELGDIVYHIESISHTATLTPSGEKSFKTTLELSHGVSKFSNSKKQLYSEMSNSKTALEEIQDSKKDGILPGTVDSETIYKDPFFDTNFYENNNSFDLPPKTGKVTATQKNKKTPKIKQNKKRFK